MSDRDLVASLQAAILRADTSWVSQPSHLRRRLEEELGADARGHRAQIHQLVVAAEERIPLRLKRNGWSPGERDELNRLLVATRGWTAEASDWAVTTWAAALGLTEERPAAPLKSAALPRPKAPPAVDPRRVPARGNEGWDGATDMPSEYFARETELPSSDPIVATRLPDVVRPAPPLPPPAGPPHQAEIVRPSPKPSPQPKPKTNAKTKATASSGLPRRGTRACTRKTAKFLGHELDVAYVAKAGRSPALLLLLLLPIGLAALLTPPLVSSFLLMVFFLIAGLGNLLWPTRILAVKGDAVWLLTKKVVSVKPTAVVAQGTRREIVFAGGRPLPSVRFAGQRLWFQYPIVAAARRLPAPTVEGAAS